VAKKGSQLVEYLIKLAIRLDRRLRLLDWRAQRSFDGPGKKWFGVDGYSPIAFLVPLVAVLFQILGPSLGWRGGVAVLLLLGMPVVLFLLVRALGAQRLWLAQVISVSAISLAVFAVFARPEVRAADPALYRHILAPVLWVLVGALLMARILSRRMFNKYRGSFAEYLQEAELFVKPEAPASVTRRSIFWSFATVPVRHPLQLLLFPAFAVLVLQDTRLMWQWGVILLLLSWGALTLAGFHERLQFMISIPRRVFFVGAQLIISVLVILLAIGRVADFSYVSMVFDSTAGAVVAALVFSAYFTFWFYEYWINRFLCEELLRSLDTDEKRKEARVPYPIKAGVRPKYIRVEEQGRVVQIHGAERFVVVGRNMNQAASGDGTVFQFYYKLEFFKRILEWARARGQIAEKQATALRCELERRIQYYFLGLNAVLVLALVAAWILIGRLPQVAELCCASRRRLRGKRRRRIAWRRRQPSPRASTCRP